ncbi:MAG TPA: cupin domain-containing protein [Burkholderiales bacterium]|nr:cupin domain-containing protein [Burkholderiales bacterium]
MKTALKNAGPSGGLDAFFADIRRASLDTPGSAGQPVVRPKEELAVPHLWKNAEIRRLLKTSEHVALDERRMLRFVNPGTPGWKYVTPTLSVSIQQILPGEVAVPHRHTASAIRFFLEGSSYTTVEEDKCEMRRGDLVVTPGWEWHDYGNESQEPGIWIDALDLPMIQYLDSCGYLKSIDEEVGYEVSKEPKLKARASGISEQRYAAVGLKPMTEASGTSRRAGLIHYRWENTRAALDRLAASGESNAFDDILMEYVDPATARSVYPTFACCIQMIRPGVHTLAHRQASSAVYYVLEGEGRTVVGGRVYEWGAGDFFVVPSYFWHEHAGTGAAPAILFSVQDFPLMKNLGIYREERHPEGRQKLG